MRPGGVHCTFLSHSGLLRWPSPAPDGTNAGHQLAGGEKNIARDDRRGRREARKTELYMRANMRPLRTGGPAHPLHRWHM